MKPEDFTIANFSSVLKQFGPLIARFVNRNLHAYAYGADDLRQECHIAVFRAVKGYRPDRGVTPMTYLFRVLANHMRDVVRKSVKRVQFLQMDPDQSFEPVEAERPVSDREDELAAVLSLCTTDDAALLFDRYVNEMSLLQIAEQHGVTPQWIGRTIQKIKNHLRSEFTGV